MARKRKPNGRKNGTRYDRCRSGADFRRAAATHPAYGGEKNGGEHGVHILGPEGHAVCPDHPGDMPTGTRCALVKRLVAIGLGVLALVGLLQIDVVF